ncbi:hypothetical protein CK203_023294 [Vitis vinifera]|uniref:CCHC-type domain-containing protein n=1 Tax=Vitis vinifera TaxID=29760 RepID=A0A438J1V9_VITVI|nr:hypothetical protein CK203_023294 [Vitis vinifera]
MKEGESVDAYFTRTLIIANKMKIHGENMQQVVIIEKILRSMTSSLLVHENMMNQHGEDEQALKVTYDDRIGGRGGSRARGAFQGRGRGRGGQTFSKAIVKCYKCHQLGHFQYECPKWEKEANNVELEEKEEMLLMSYVELNQSRREDVWFLDSRCSNHTCANKEWFSGLDEEFRQSVKLGNNSKMTMLGKGNIRWKIAGVTQVITDVFYIPELKNNLLSVGQLQERGVAILIQHGVCRVYHPKKGFIMQTTMYANKMFILLAKILSKASTCFQTILEDNTHLWHCRYGHLSFKGLRTLQYKQMGRGLPQLKAPSKICTDCMLRKQHKDAIPKRSLWRASQRLQLVHANICGPIKPVSNSKKRYFISFIDDYSRKIGVESSPLTSSMSFCKANGISRRSNEEARLDILEWGDSNEEGNEHDQSEEESEEEVATEKGGEVSLSSSKSPVENSPTSEESSSKGRNRRVPFWMEDYVSGGEFSEEEVEHYNLVLFTSTANPTTFEEAIQSSKWKVAMDLEIETIERNGT